MGKISKKRAKANEKVDSEKFYNLQEAMALVKEVNTTKFDASVDVHIRLGIDPRKADQALRGTVNLPNGTGKNKTVLVLCTPIDSPQMRILVYLLFRFMLSSLNTHHCPDHSCPPRGGLLQGWHSELAGVGESH